jgi:hypothetical protein
MSQYLVWLIAFTALLALAGAMLSALRRHRRRRARHLHHAQEHAHPHSVPPRAGMGTDRSAVIRAHAERCARRDWAAGISEPHPLNPWGSRSAQAVLWQACYQHVQQELRQANGGSKPAQVVPGTQEPLGSH